ILTHEEMEAVYEDLENMVKPSWVTSVLTTLLSVGPKLKSDQWKTIGSLYLPVSLVCLWSDVHQDDERSKHCHELLDLSMQLLSSVATAISCVTSNPHADEFLRLMSCYCQELQRLFPNYNVHCNHHMAIHIAEFLRMYGPVHGWWTFPFKRMIGMLQRISTNYKPGKLA
ncbi:hypothetical protein L208DRAFT_1288357, partial [Tricholoma matsutake]